MTTKTTGADWVVRSEFTFERYNQGLKICQAILAMWEKHEQIPVGSEGRTTTINANCEAIISEFGLTYGEWHYWCRQASEAKP